MNIITNQNPDLHLIIDSDLKNQTLAGQKASLNYWINNLPKGVHHAHSLAPLVGWKTQNEANGNQVATPIILDASGSLRQVEDDEIILGILNARTGMVMAEGGYQIDADDWVADQIEFHKSRLNAVILEAA